MKTIKRLSMLFLATFVLASCSNDDDTAPDNPPVDPPTLNIIQTAQATADLSILVDAVVKAGLVDTLNGPGPFTVLAPTNAAFEALLATNTDWNTIQDVPNDVLTPILLNHVIGGEVPSSTLDGGMGYAATNADGPEGRKLSLFFNGTTGVVFNGISTVSIADVNASNGIVHIVDTVIGLPTLLTFATADPVFSNLAAAVTDAGQEGVAGIISAATLAAPITVFAPINTAFQDVLDSQVAWVTVSDIPDAALNGILAHHAVGGNTTSDELTDGMTITMANMQDITLMLPSDIGNAATITSAAGTSSEVIIVDVQAVNGVIHAIDTVLMPM